MATKIRLGNSHIYAVQEFCNNHSIVETSAVELEEMIGLPFRQTGKALSELDWELVKIGKKHFRKKNGSNKIFSSSAVKFGKIILEGFENHYQIYFVKKVEKLLEHNDFSNTKFLRKNLGISGIQAANLFKKLGWTAYTIAKDYTTYKRAGVFED